MFVPKSMAERQCNFEDSAMPCDYCYARGLECGPKLPTPRKLLEWGSSALMQPVAIAQPRTWGGFTGELHIQIPSGTAYHNTGYNSANYDGETPFPSPINNRPAGHHRPYSTAAGFASALSPLSF